MIATVYAPGVYGGVIIFVIGLLSWDQNIKRRKERDEQRKEQQELVDAIRGSQDAPPAHVEPSQPAQAATAGHRHSTSALGRWRARQ